MGESWLIYIFFLFVLFSFYIFCKDKYISKCVGDVATKPTGAVPGSGPMIPASSGFAPLVFQGVPLELATNFSSGTRH